MRLCEKRGERKHSSLTQEKVNKLARHKTSLIKLTKNVPNKEKRKILVRKGGGFLPFLLFVAPLIAKEVSKIAYLTQQKMLKFMKEKQQDSFLPDLRKYYEA